MNPNIVRRVVDERRRAEQFVGLTVETTGNRRIFVTSATATKDGVIKLVGVNSDGETLETDNEHATIV